MMLSKSLERGGPTGLLLHVTGENGSVAGTRVTQRLTERQVIQLTRAGFVYSGSRTEPATAKCVFCFKKRIFATEDDPCQHVMWSGKGTCTARDTYFVLTDSSAGQNPSPVDLFIDVFMAAVITIHKGLSAVRNVTAIIAVALQK
ncbi:hypothetical protein KIN20_014597 [Parelaphostrongylus tenuis]|uniref:Uncharacterized protein n=1 Tax=Parelaphostrongylus tenuis TaxID=148309 RepID=A0AAD5QS09_PARTN|nr:hypothetical protein KIN20_009991 [Parelaphostrongylus tenuis]KAJ1356801.1 hypothetical protein KIN20_014597 [Parelaphostrongylus tenuis]